MRLKEHGGLVASLGSRLLGELAELGDGLFLSGLEAGPLGVPVRDLIAGIEIIFFSFPKYAKLLPLKAAVLRFSLLTD